MSSSSRIGFLIVLAMAPAVARSGEYDLSRLSDTDPIVRREAWNSVAHNDDELRRSRKQIVVLLLGGLQDTDKEVRIASVTTTEALAAISLEHNEWILSDRPAILDALFEILDQGDGGLQEKALKAIRMGTRPSERIEDALLDRYSKMESPACRTLIIEIVARNRRHPAIPTVDPSVGVIDICIDALSDPTDSVRAAAAHAIARMDAPPPKALPLLVHGLDASHPFPTQFYLMAIAQYRADAQPYLPMLEAFRQRLVNLNGPERESLQNNLNSAIHLIREADSTR